MAIRIPILTSFDPKGLKQANAQLGKLQGSFSSLGRNLAVAGAVVGAAFVAIGKSVQDAAESQKVFAQTEAVLKSMGTTANGTAQDISNLASSLQKTTAFSDEAILAGQNLLLTFKNIQNQAGAGNDIFNQTSTLMLDVARAMGTSATGEAIRLGKALNDPVKGISALTRVGIQFTDQQKEQIKALAQSGDLMGAQKIILAELQQQFGGSAAAYAQTFAGQVEGLNNDLNDLSEEIGFMVMPALQGMIAEFRDLIPIIGPQLKAAIQSVDWKALTQSVIGFTQFLIQNGATIAKVVIGIFALNTAFKLMQVAIGISNVAIALKTWYLAQLATGMTKATIATNLFGGALKLIPWVAAAAGIASITTELFKATANFTAFRSELDKSSISMSNFDKDLSAAAVTFLDFDIKGNPFLQLLQDGITLALQLSGALKDIPKNINTTVTISAGYANAEARRLTEQAFGRGSLDMSLGKWDQSGTNTGTAGNKGAGAKAMSGFKSLQANLAKQAKITRKGAKLMGKGLSEGLVSQITGGKSPIKTANKVLKKIAETGGKFAKKIQRQFNRTASGQAELESAAQAASEAARASAEERRVAQEEATRAAEEAARKEAEALAERERVYNSFLDSVKNTFASIKDSIMGAFDLTQLGGSTNAITRNMEKLLTKLRSFATNVSQLSSMGLNPALLQQVISAGPIAGAALAQSLVMGGAGALSSINAGYAEFGSLASQIATTGTNSMFGTEAQQNIYNIEVSGGVGSGATIGKAIVDAIKAYERTSGAVWQGA